MIPTEEHEEINPKCPLCKKEILRVFFRELETVFGKGSYIFVRTAMQCLVLKHYNFDRTIDWIRCCI
ncbi:MAG TPA: hypothetical protein VLM39_00475 [Ignavibacteriaceae bacterium]|nr:hypothetical protein [Ignavibacteriaceae bacterium]